MFSTSSVNVIGFDPNRHPWPLCGCDDAGAAQLVETHIYVDEPTAWVTQTKLVLMQANIVPSLRSGALAVELFYKEIVASTVCSSLAVLHGDNHAEDR